MHILGISALYHDSAAALVQDGQIVAAVQEERFSRKKHDPRLPVNAINYCLSQAELTGHNLDAVVYYENPFLTLDRFVKNAAALGDDADVLIEKTFDSMFTDRIWIHESLRNILGRLGKRDELLVTRHHVAHAASAFYPSPFSSAAILTLDGVGEWATTTLAHGREGKICFLRELDYPHSLGLLYSAFTYFCGFKVNSGDYKLMGLAPYGQPVYVNTIFSDIIDLKQDGSYRLNMDYFDFHRSTVMTNDRFAKLFGGSPRKQETEITRREMDMAASVQRVIEEAVLRLASTVKRDTGEKNLVMAGGVALNCVANGKLYQKGLFDQIWVQPAAGDAGGALGAALFAQYNYFNAKRHVQPRGLQMGSYLGNTYTNEEIKQALKPLNGVYKEYDTKEALYTEVAARLAAGDIVGYFNGRMEYGPRALGARSILADPRQADMQARLNLKIKYRESFRPFAPSVLAERVADYFEMADESPYMLMVAGVQPDLRRPFDLSTWGDNEHADMLPIINQVRSDIPAVTHVDYSARIQTVNALESPDYHRLIKEFESLTGCGVLVNTSFNVRGEPIVRTPEEAYLCFMRTEMDVLVLENCILYKADQPALQSDENWRQIYEMD